MSKRKRSAIRALGPALMCAAMAWPAARAGEVRAAVAANFSATAKEIGAAYAAASGDRVLFSFGPTGQLFAQIAQGAPFDVFLAADRARPQRAVDQGFAVAHSLFIYATGRLVLYSRTPGVVTGADTLRQAVAGKLAIANPATAPYGAAAVQVLRALGVYDRLRSKLVFGNGVAQAYQFVATGNAELGLVALSQVAGRDRGSRWLVPAGLHRAIVQAAVLLRPGADNPAAHAFLAFLKGPGAGAVKTKYGYDSED